MATITRFEDLEIWKLARILTNDFDLLTDTTSLAKDYELRSQMSRSSGSVMDNIAEGFERFSNKEFTQFLVIAKGSNGEVRSQLYRAYDRQHISDNILEEKLHNSHILGSKISSFINYLRSSSYKSKPTQHPTSTIEPPTSAL